MTSDTDDLEFQTPDDARVRAGAVAAGLMLVVVGVGTFVGARQGFDIHVARLIAPMVLITLGASMLLDRSAFVVGRRRAMRGGAGGTHRRRGGLSSGVWLIGIGLWMAFSQNHFFGLTAHNSWPLLVVLSGIVMVIRGSK